MKLKTLAKVSIVFIVIGFILTGIGYAINREFNVRGFNINISAPSNKNQNNNKHINLITKAKELEAFKNIDIDTNVSDIKIIPSDKYKIELKYKEDEVLEYELKDSTLFVKQDYEYKLDKNKNEDSINEIKIYIPKNANMDNIIINSMVSDINLKSFEIKDFRLYNKVGDIDINDLNIDNFYLESDVGSVNISNASIGKGEVYLNIGEAYLNNINSKTFKAHSKVGDVDLSKSNIANKLDIKSGVGDININTKAFGDIDIKGGTSDIEVSINDKEEIYNYNLDCNVGDIEVDGKAYEKDLKVNNNTKNNIDINCTTGSVELNFD
ncbi:DUF4097 family beta strand repeat-containing protein [Romboutsia sp. 1001713B170131_170501_G6]|uniref:DUF4097 family beta strand repeat-containing protein n=1 Tax=Romboutsia sp. 1001713B170131_170501_G6 TaxID=2787108 RepID=UPI0018AB1E8C|nr:DUF4097 family beta strand repeat-containing protein [Romboutsia sp. 1001713B170131_170501_G6]